MSHIIDFADARRRFETDDRSAIAFHERETDPENPDHAEHLIIGRTPESVQAKILALEEELANHLGRHGYAMNFSPPRRFDGLYFATGETLLYPDE